MNRMLDSIHTLELLKSMKDSLSFFTTLFSLFGTITRLMYLCRKKLVCKEFYTICHIKFQVLGIIGNKSHLMVVRLSMRFQFLLFVMIKIALFLASLSGTKVVSVSSLSGHGLIRIHTEHNNVFERIKIENYAGYELLDTLRKFQILVLCPSFRVWWPALNTT